MAIVLAGAAVVTMDGENRVLAAADLRIEGERIAALGEAGTLHRPGDSVLDCRDRLIMPGLVDTHTHVAAGFFRGLVEDVGRDFWRDGYGVPGQERFTLDDYRLSTRASCCELLLNGVTCIADRWGSMDVLAEEIARTGIRAIVGHTLSDRTAEADWPVVEALFERWGVAPESRVTAGIAPHAPDSCSDALLRRCAAVAEKHGCRLFIHAAQSAWEIEKLNARGYDGVLACLANNGLVGPQVVAAHCIYLGEREIAAWPESRISIAHCPASNLKIEARTMPLHRLVGRTGIGLGTDWAASDNGMDMLAETRLAALVGKLLADDPKALPVETMLRMATIEGARVLGLDGVTGSIEPGKLADLAILDLTPLEANPRHNLAANLLYSMSVRCVRDVMVGGEFLVRDGMLVRFDAGELQRETMSRSSPPSGGSSREADRAS
ncbi:MAG: amidohydrolase family protein [Alphaproteobacteria bacterium]